MLFVYKLYIILNFTHDFSVLDEHERWHAGDFVLVCDLLILVNVDFQEDYIGHFLLTRARFIRIFIQVENF